jgi:hypothetical protein
MTVPLRVFERRKIHTMPVCCFLVQDGTLTTSESQKEDHANEMVVIAGFFTGGSLAIRGGAKAARNSAIGCACLLAVIEGVGIMFQRMMADNTKLEVGLPFPASCV